MSEDRTQAASKHRREQARERGQVAYSPELTGSAGLLAAVLLLGAWGDDLATALLTLVRGPLLESPALSADPGEVVARLRHLALGVAWPLGVVASGFAIAALAAHQLQTGGLLVPALLAPDPTRLWAAGQGPGFFARGARGAWALIKAAVVVAVAGWAIRSGWRDFQLLGEMEMPALARASGRSLWQLGWMLAAATLALGLIDLAFQHRRLEALLRMTPEEQREDQRSMEGDPALRARRRRLAQARRGGSSDLLAGASLVLTGPSGLTLVLAGGPPPRRIMVLAALRGPEGLRLRREGEAARLPLVDAPDLARRLARRGSPAPPLPAESLAELAGLWPSAPSHASGH